MAPPPSDSPCGFRSGLVVECRFVAEDHAGFERDGVLLRADALRAFVAVDEETYAVARAVVIGLRVVPEELAGEHVELRTPRAYVGNLMRQCDGAFRGEGEVAFLLGRGGSEATVRVMSVVP